MLANKTALVTGASGGMGRATTLALGDEAKAVVDQIRANGGQADAIAADLAAPDGAYVQRRSGNCYCGMRRP